MPLFCFTYSCTLIGLCGATVVLLEWNPTLYLSFYLRNCVAQLAIVTDELSIFFPVFFSSTLVQLINI